jgi:hypothetical protein
MVRAIEYLPRNLKALSSNPYTPAKKKMKTWEEGKHQGRGCENRSKVRPTVISLED